MIMKFLISRIGFPKIMAYSICLVMYSTIKILSMTALLSALLFFVEKPKPILFVFNKK